MGTNDLAKELHASHVPGRAPLLGGLGLCLLAARATGKVILDGVYNDIKDPEGFAAECRAGQQMGFDGKTLIHPSQVEPCNEAFAPSAEEVEKAGRIIAARSEEHTSELQSLMRISYADFCLKKKKTNTHITTH